MGRAYRLNDYSTGRRGEVLVARLLCDSGHREVALSPGSRSPCDVRSRVGREKFCTQVRTTTTGSTRRLSQNERAALWSRAAVERRQPVEGYVDLRRRGVVFEDSYTGDVLSVVEF